MKTRETTPGKTYSVHTSSGCTVSDKNGWSKTIDAPDGYFTAHAGEVTIDGDDAADVREVFKLAPYQKLRLLGVVGGNAGGLPAGFKRVEWLQSDGKAYIKTNIPGYTQSRVKVQYLDFGTTLEAWLFGSHCGLFNGSDWRSGLALMFYSGKTNALAAHKSASWPASNTVDEVLTVELDLNEIKINGIPATSRERTTPEFPAPTFTIFAYHSLAYRTDGSIVEEYIGIRIPTQVRLYSLSMSGEYSCNFIPAIDDVGNPCLYESVQKKTYYNSGSGAFLYPTESTTFSLRRVLPDWGKLTEHGLRRLYHAPANYKGELIDYALENGYKPIVETEQPEEGYWSPRWTETEEEIVLEWVETEPPMDDYLTQTTDNE